MSGIIKDEASIRNFWDNRRTMGEIITVRVTGFESSGKIILSYAEQPLNMISQSHPPQSFTDSSQLLLENQVVKDTIFQPNSMTTAIEENMPFNNLFLSPKT